MDILQRIVIAKTAGLASAGIFAGKPYAFRILLIVTRTNTILRRIHVGIVPSDCSGNRGLWLKRRGCHVSSMAISVC